jgi:hypothetical protein
MSKINDQQDKVSLLVHSYAWWLQIIGLALAYLITGKLGTLLAIPPGYATAIWPPSGVALAGLVCEVNGAVMPSAAETSEK